MIIFIRGYPNELLRNEDGIQGQERVVGCSQRNVY